LITEGIKTEIRNEFEKHSESLTTLMKNLLTQAGDALSYKSALLSGPPPNANPRIIAQEGIKA
jgi:hypothetical protein